MVSYAKILDSADGYKSNNYLSKFWSRPWIGHGNFLVGQGWARTKQTLYLHFPLYHMFWFGLGDPTKVPHIVHFELAS
jgi:hypothetical protein